MLMRLLGPFVCLLVIAAAAGAQPSDVTGGPLTAARVAALAAERAPDVLVAGTRVSEAQGQLAGARALSQENPMIEGLHGTGSDPDRATEIELQIPFGLGLRRARRVSESKAAVDREQHLMLDTQRRIVGSALAAFYRVLHAEEREALARDRKALAEELRRVVSEKVNTGDAARLDLLVADVELSRSESEVLSEARNVAQARLELARILGFASGSSLEISGQLSDRSLFDTRSAMNPDERADVVAAESEVKSASAAVSLARMAILPELSFRMNYQRSQVEDIVRPGLAVSLPVFNHGQGTRMEAEARRQRAAVQLSARRAAAHAELEAAQAAYDSSLASVREIENRGLPRAEETEDLARQGYEAGKLDLPALLLVRTGALDTRREHADRLLDAALTGIDLVMAEGSLPAPNQRRTQ